MDEISIDKEVLSTQFVVLSLRAAAVLYTAGTLAQVLRLSFAFPLTEMPFAVDWVIIGLGSVGALGLVLGSRDIAYRGSWEKIVHWLIIVHLGISVLMHLWAVVRGDHEMFRIFSYQYSAVAVVYFAFFAWRQWTVRLEGDGFAGVGGDTGAGERW